MLNVLSWSGGKDSTALLLHIIKNKLPLDKVVYCEIKFNKETSGEHPLMAEWIPIAIKTINKKLKENGYNCEVEIITAKRNYYEQVFTARKRGANKGVLYGFPNPRCAWCNSLLKLEPLNKYIRNLQKHYPTITEYIGIAIDEANRVKRLKEKENNSLKFVTLADFGITENMALDMCKEQGLLSPIYNKQFRGGCWFCPKASISSIYDKWRDYPLLFQLLIDMEKRLKDYGCPQYGFYYQNKCISDIVESFFNGYIPKKRKICEMEKQISMFDLIL